MKEGMVVPAFLLVLAVFMHRETHMDITLDPKLEQRLRYKIARGEYSSVEAALNEALRRLLEPEAELADPLPLEEMRREIMIGVEQSDRGDVVPFDVEYIKAEGRRIFASRS